MPPHVLDRLGRLAVVTIQADLMPRTNGECLSVTNEAMRTILDLAYSISSVDAERLEDRRANASAALYGPLSQGTVGKLDPRVVRSLDSLS